MSVAHYFLNTVVDFSSPPPRCLIVQIRSVKSIHCVVSTTIRLHDSLLKQLHHDAERTGAHCLPVVI